MRRYAGWLVAAALSVFALSAPLMAGPTTPAQIDGCVYNATPPTLSDGQTAVVQCDTNGKIQVAATATLTNPTIGAAVPATANYIAGNKGGLLTGITLDGSGYLQVNCAAGCTGGNANGQATMANSAPVVIASNQSAVPVSQSGAWTVSGTGTAGSAATGVVTIQGIAAMTKLLVTPDSVALPANQSVNMAQVAGTTTDTNSGVKSAGTMRVVLATDQPQLTNKLLVTPDSVALPANQSTNESQINGVTPLMGNGVTGTGSQRVTIASDNTAFAVNSTLQTQTDTIMVGGVNIKEINAVTPLMGNGVTGTGSVRVTLASDTTSNSNPFLVGGAITPADALALGTNAVRTYSFLGAYNGTTGDLAREVANSTNSTGTGILGSGQIGQCDDTSPTAITENSFGNARIDCAVHSQLVTAVPSATAGGTTLFTLTLANSTNATNVKASAGQLYSISGFNMSSATPVWISVYNTAGTPTCGTSIIQQFLIPGSTTGAGFVYDFAVPKAFATGIGFCATTGIAGTGAPAATTYVLNIDYK